MRVLLDVSAVPARPAGAGVYTWALARGLSTSAGVELHLVTRRGDTERWAALAPEAVLHAATPVAASGAPRCGNSSLRRSSRIGSHRTCGTARTTRCRCAIASRPWSTVHDLTFFDHPEWHERSKVPYFRRMIKASARRAAAIVCVSEYTATRLAAVAPPRGRVHVARHGVDHTTFRPDADVATDLALLAAHGIRPPYVGFVGTIEPRKAIPTLVAAFAPLAHAHRDLRLAIVGGDGWGATAVRDAIAASGIATHVIRTGYVDDDVVPALYRQAAAVAYPSLEEGFGVPALEALACGAPLVTTRGSALSEVVGDAALTVPPGVTDALTAALQTLVDDTARAAALRAAGPIQAASLHLGSIGRVAPRRVPERVGARRRMKAFITGASGFAGPYLARAPPRVRRRRRRVGPPGRRSTRHPRSPGRPRPAATRTAGGRVPPRGLHAGR